MKICLNKTDKELFVTYDRSFLGLSKGDVIVFENNKYSVVNKELVISDDMFFYNDYTINIEESTLFVDIYE